MQFIKWCITGMVFFALCSCVSLNSVSLTQIPEKRVKKISAEDSKVIILGLSFDNDFADTVVRKLQKKCDGGKIQGILTKDENVNYFFYLVYKKRVVAQGYCDS